MFDEWNRVRDLLEELYWGEEKSSTEICRIFKYPSSTNLVAKIFKYLAIKPKSTSEATYLNYKNGTVNPPHSFSYMHGWHTTWDNKQVFLRSSYEFKFAKYLDKLRIHYDVEVLRIEYFDTINRCKRIAIPDFYIYDEKLIIEIKSGYTLDIQNMIDRAKEYITQGYDFLLFLENQYLTLEDLMNLKNNTIPE